MRDDPNYREAWTCPSCGRTLHRVVLPVRCNCTRPKTISAEPVARHCRGLGDVAVIWIGRGISFVRLVTFGRVDLTPKNSCGCDGRAKWMNRHLPAPWWLIRLLCR